MQQVTGAAFSAWQPVQLTTTEINAPHTRGPYYGMVAIADFIGKAANFRVKNVELKEKNISAYAGYNSGSLSKVAIVNLDVWHPKAGTERPTQKISLHLPNHISTAEVQRLAGPNVDSFQNITWAGVEWTYENKGVGVNVLNNTETFKAQNSEIEFNIPASEAVIVTFYQ